MYFNSSSRKTIQIQQNSKPIERKKEILTSTRLDIAYGTTSFVVFCLLQFNPLIFQINDELTQPSNNPLTKRTM